VPAHQLPGALDRVPDVEQPADQRLDPAQRPALVTGEPVRQRAFPQLLLQPGPLLRAQLLPRHRPFGQQRRGPAVPPGLVPAPHRPWCDPQVLRDLVDPVSASEPPGGLQPQPLTPLLLSGRIPAPLRIPHASVIRPQPADVTTPISTSSSWLAALELLSPTEPTDIPAISVLEPVWREPDSALGPAVAAGNTNGSALD